MRSGIDFSQHGNISEVFMAFTCDAPMGRPLCRSWSAAMGVAAKQATWMHTAGQSRSCSDSCCISAGPHAEDVRHLPSDLQTHAVLLA